MGKAHGIAGFCPAVHCDVHALTPFRLWQEAAVGMWHCLQGSEESSVFLTSLKVIQ